MTPTELLRRDFELIARLIPEGARVLDLGCGGGELLSYVRDARGARIHGLELDLDDVAACVTADVPVVQADLDEGLRGFTDASFDVVVLSQTLQVVRKPALVLREMLRVGRQGIVSFPNFGNWRIRTYLGLRGRMPVSRSIPYSWYDTPNIHHTTLSDFDEFVAANGGRVERLIPLRESHQHLTEVRFAPNLLAETAIAVVTHA